MCSLGASTLAVNFQVCLIPRVSKMQKNINVMFTLTVPCCLRAVVLQRGHIIITFTIFRSWGPSTLKAGREKEPDPHFPSHQPFHITKGGNHILCFLLAIFQPFFFFDPCLIFFVQIWGGQKGSFEGFERIIKRPVAYETF